MGRHTKEVARAWSWLLEQSARQRQFEDWAAQLPDDERRILHRIHAKRRQAAIDNGRHYLPRRPSYLRNLTCGARTQAGEPCRMTGLFANGRCVWHGGKSTGPRTPDGRARALENLQLGRIKRGKSRH